MSRHTISDSGGVDHYGGISYNRSLNEFFYQKRCSKTEALLASGSLECEWTECRSTGMVIPEELPSLLIEEARDRADTQSRKDWRAA